MPATPRYEQLARELGMLIERGVLRSGDRIPSLREASEQHRVSVGTVHRAYELLEERGLVEVRPQSGVYVRARLPRLTPGPQVSSHPAPEPAVSRPSTDSTHVDVDYLVRQVLQSIKHRDIVPLGSAFASPELYPHDKLNRAAANGARRLPAWASVFDLPPGNVELRRLISLRYLKSGIVIPPDELVVTCGAMEAINLSLHAVAKPGDIIAIESPAFYSTLCSAEQMGLKVVEIATHPRHGIDLGSLRNALQSLMVKACVIMSNFQNPLGCCMPDEKKRALVALLASENIPLIEDDVNAELYFGTVRPPPLKAFDAKGLVLHCGSFSKCLAPGYRIGWVAAGRFKEDVERLKFITSISTDSLAQAAIAEYLKHGGFERHLRQLRQRLATGLRAMTQAVNAHFPRGCRITRPEGGYMLWIELPRSTSALRLHHLALAEKISVVPGPLFSAKRKYKNCIRLNFGHPDTRATRNAVRTLGRLIRDLTQ